ncbi:MAG: hypothetical protein ACP5SD_06410 [Elusimicrobiales bacterium]
MVSCFLIYRRKKENKRLFCKDFKNIGFYEILKSGFVFPAVVKEEIEFIIEYYDIKKYVRYAVARR